MGAERGEEKRKRGGEEEEEGRKEGKKSSRRKEGRKRSKGRKEGKEGRREKGERKARRRSFLHLSLLLPYVAYHTESHVPYRFHQPTPRDARCDDGSPVTKAV